MLNELIKTVAKKANIPELAAQVAVNTVITALKAKLPPALRGTLDAFMGTATIPKSSSPTKKSTTVAKKTTVHAGKSNKNPNPLGDLGAIAGALGGLLGKK
jgi:hypothetical protein